MSGGLFLVSPPPPENFPGARLPDRRLPIPDSLHTGSYLGRLQAPPVLLAHAPMVRSRKTSQFGRPTGHIQLIQKKLCDTCCDRILFKHCAWGGYGRQRGTAAVEMPRCEACVAAARAYLDSAATFICDAADGLALSVNSAASPATFGSNLEWC